MSGCASDGIATFISPMPLGGLVGRCAAAVAVNFLASTIVLLALVTSS